MNRIRLLSEQVANQIAAGEVIERPASVVKELVENSLDAAATRIVVEVGAGGRSLIRVTDDGWGMSRDDALLCLERHATSKITHATDLAAISTMGFRGEAIPSIASVSRFTLTTRERDDATGEATQIVIHGGKILEVKSASSPAGTTIEVRQLFFNLPARRKFLRSEETERSHIAHYLTLVALAHPQVGFTLVSDTRTVWQLPPVKWTNAAERFEALRERLRQLQGSEVPLLKLDFSTSVEERPEPPLPPDDSTSILNPPADPPASPPTSPFRIWGFLGGPGVSRSTRDEQFLFVNQRPVENRGLNFALLEGYHNVLMKGRFPVCCLFLEVDPAAVDVNVHPQKREVRFRDEYALRRLVAKAVREALQAFHAPSPSAPPPLPVVDLTPPLITPDLPILPPSPTLPEPVSSATPLPTPRFNRVPPPLPPPPPIPASSTESTLAKPAPITSLPNPISQVPPVAPVFSGPVPLLRVPLRLVGVIGRLYVVLESDRGLVLLDQHAAHERILYEQMLARLESSSKAAAQRILLPETLELSARDASFLKQNLETLSRLGVELREFGERTFLLEALPPFAQGGQPKQFVTGLIDELRAAGSGVNTLRLGEDVVAKTVCRHAVKANDPLSGPELEKLVMDLRACVMPYTCPHGRPTLIELSWRELEKKFGRTA
ncbi:MAG: DNA mismatch repair endonuclease MutL [Verrucomicrobia bacterium]|nr:DNA mismatch repair endonuclease MutL [Verrucomicrobiota bacterium]